MSTESDVVTLGSGKLLSRRIGPRAALLDRAKVNGLPVPPGVIITEELIRECYSSYGSARGRKKSQQVEQNVRLVREDFLRDRLLTALPLLTEGKNWKHDFSVNEGRIKVAIRPAFSLNDGEQEPPPAMFHTELNVDGSSAIIILGAIKEVLASAHAYQKAMYAEELEKTEEDVPAVLGHQLRRDVMIMPMVPARCSGLAFLQHDFEDDIVQWTEGLGHEITQDTGEAHEFLLPRLLPHEPASSHPKREFQKRLQSLIAKVRLVFGDSRDWEIEWADDGKNIWLLQIRPMARPVKRVEFLSGLMDAELLREPLSPFALTLYETTANKAFDFLRVLNPAFPVRRKFALAIEGRLYVNLSLLLDCLRILGLPTRFALDFLLPPALHASVPQSGWNWRRIFRHRRVLWRLWKQRLNLSKDLDIHLQKVDSNARHLHGNLRETIEQLVKDTTETFKFLLLLHFALVFPLRLLERLGLLQGYLMRYRSSPISFFKKTIEEDSQKQIPPDDADERSAVIAPPFAEWQGRLAPNYDPAFPPASAEALQKRWQEAASRFRARDLQDKLNWKLVLGLPLWYPLFRLLENKRKVSISFFSVNEKYHTYLEFLNSKENSLWKSSIEDLLSSPDANSKPEVSVPANGSGLASEIFFRYECSIREGRTEKASLVDPVPSSLRSDKQKPGAYLIFSRLQEDGPTEPVGELLSYKASKKQPQNPEAWIFSKRLLCEEAYLLPGSHLLLEQVAPFSPLGLLLRGLGCVFLVNIEDATALKDRQIARLYLADLASYKTKTGLFPRISFESKAPAPLRPGSVVSRTKKKAKAVSRPSKKKSGKKANKKISKKAAKKARKNTQKKPAIHKKARKGV